MKSVYPVFLSLYLVDIVIVIAVFIMIVVCSISISIIIIVVIIGVVIFPLILNVFEGLTLVSNSLFLTNLLTVSIHFSSNPFTASKPVRIIIFPPKRAFVQILRFRILWSFADFFFSFLSLVLFSIFLQSDGVKIKSLSVSEIEEIYCESCKKKKNNTGRLHGAPTWHMQSYFF